MVKAEVLVTLNTKMDPDQGYGEYIELADLAEVLQYQTKKYFASGEHPMIRLVGDSIQIVKYVDCTDEEFDETRFKEMDTRLDVLHEQAAELGYRLKSL